MVCGWSRSTSTSSRRSGSSSRRRAPTRVWACRAAQALELFDAQLGSRHLDLAARWLRDPGRGLLHHRLGRARGQRRGGRRAAAHRPGAAALPLRRLLPGPGRARCAGPTRLRDVLLGIVAATDGADRGRPAQGVRPPDLAVIPQTSTIASHLPRAVGVAFAIDRGPRSSACPAPWPADAIVGVQLRRRLGQPLHRGRRDQRRPPAASAGLPLPLLLVCEDNGHRHQRADPGRLGRRTPTAAARAALLRRRRHAIWPPAYDTAHEAADVRPRRHRAAGVPAPAHGPADGPRRLRRGVRPTAGPTTSPPTWTRDPLLAHRAAAGRRRGAHPRRRCWSATRPCAAEVMALADEVAGAPQLGSAAEVMAPLAPATPGRGGRGRHPAGPAEQRPRRSAARCPSTRAR